MRYNLYLQGGFYLALPNFSTKMKIAKQPIMVFLSNRIFWNSSFDCLIGNFLFVIEIGECQLKKPPCIILLQAVRQAAWHVCKSQ